MPRFKYTIMETDADWVEHLYHTDVPVLGGFAETDDPIAIESLLYRGFSLIEDAVDEVIQTVGDVIEGIVAEVTEVVDEIVTEDTEAEPES